ncbi:hypothetical protein E4T42_05560 [Aureobasidium subglaciale]|nr:hypothetical protein E4T42_05560 [Aureobasidium subglaciale]
MRDQRNKLSISEYDFGAQLASHEAPMSLNRAIDIAADASQSCCPTWKLQTGGVISTFQRPFGWLQCYRIFAAVETTTGFGDFLRCFFRSLLVRRINGSTLGTFTPRYHIAAVRAQAVDTRIRALLMLTFQQYDYL